MLAHASSDLSSYACDSPLGFAAVNCLPARLINAIKSSTSVYLPDLMMEWTKRAVAMPMASEPTIVLMSGLPTLGTYLRLMDWHNASTSF